MKEVFLFCPRCGVKLHETAKGMQCPSCLLFSYHHPRPTAGAILFNDQGQILLTQRGREPFQGTWDVPGGFIEMGEALEEGLRREIREEVGLYVTDLECIHCAPGFYPFQGIAYSILDFFFIGRIPNKQTIQVSDEVTRTLFFEPDDLPWDQLMSERHRQALKKSLELIKKR